MGRLYPNKSRARFGLPTLLWFAAILAFITLGSTADGTIRLGTLIGMGEDPTAHKPQSKLWQHGESWWSALSGNSGTWLWQLEDSAWNPIRRIDSTPNLHADCKRVNNLVHVLLKDVSSARLITLEHKHGSYEPWSARKTTTTFELGDSVETATLDVDSAGRLWVAYDTTDKIQVRYADSPYVSFSSPITLATGITNDDISVVTHLNDGSIGVLWSDQNDKQFGFRRHIDGTSELDWQADEIPASHSSQSVGDGMADDHLNVAVGSDGTLYAAVKTSYDKPGHTKIGLLVRRANGSWDKLHRIDTDGTRPIVVLDETAERLRVVYTRNEHSNPVVQRTISIPDLKVSVRELLMSEPLLDVTSTKDNVEGDEVILASRGSTIHGVRLTSEPTHPETPPTKTNLATTR